MWAGLTAVLLAIALSGCGARDEELHVGLPEEGPRVAYETRFEGVEGELAALLAEVARTVALEDRPPASLALLERRAENDVAPLIQALRSRGYYEPDVRVRIDGSVTPAAVRFIVETGPAYRFATIAIEVAEDAPEAPALPAAAALGLEQGARAESARVVEAESRLLRRLRESGFPYPRIADRRVVIDRRDHSMDVALTVDPGARAAFGETTFEGLVSVEEPFVRRKLPWQPGNPFDVRRYQEMRDKLLATELFASVAVTGAPEVGDDGRLPVTVAVEERRHRSIGAGLDYRTDEGPGVNLSWEHRNLFGRGERLALAVRASFVTLAGEAAFRKPDFLREDQALIGSLRAARETTDAYDSLSLTAQGLIERTLAPGMTAAGGIGYKISEVEQAGETDRFVLGFLPARFAWDHSDDLLDPTRGGRLGLDVTPFRDLTADGVTFLRSSARYTRYLQLLDAPRVVLAGRAAAGTIVGPAHARIPADERFYVGGGGSVRGYAFQLAGPLDARDDPLGGRSFVELTGEVRLRMTETLGAVIFVDAGRAFIEPYPNLRDRLFVGAGLGFRYHTPIGPIRLDIAIPTRRRGVDDRFQLYVSVGQAF